MATRFYLPSSGAAAVSPAFDSLWDVSGVADRIAMSTTKANTTNAGKSAAEGVSGGVDVLNRQFVGPNDLVAGTLAGTFRTVVICEESNSDANMFLNLVLKVVDSTGATVRGVLYAGQGTQTSSSSSASPQYEFTVTATRLSRVLSGTLTPVVAQAGDRLVAEFGYSDSNLNATSRSGTLHFGDPNAATDLAYTVDTGSTASENPWLEFDFTSNVDAVTMTATAEFLVPTIVTDVSATVEPPAATATAQFLAPADANPVPARKNVQHDALPLAVRIGDRHITREVSGLAFRKEAFGGLRSISLRLARPLDRFDPNLAALSKCYIYDGRSAETVAEGRLSDFGRSAGTDGQQWDLVAFGPAQHATDVTFPYVLVHNSTDFKRHSDSTKNATTGSDERADTSPSLLISAEEGKTVTTSWVGKMVSRLMRNAGMELGRVSCEIDAGVTDADYVLQLVVNDGSDTVVDSAGANTTQTTLEDTIAGSIPAGADAVSIRVVRNSTGTTGAENQWFEFWNINQRALLIDKDGTDRVTGYGNDYILAADVVKDLLGRHLAQFDGANATVSTSGTYQIDQLSYPDGVTAEQVLNDLAILEPAYVWYAKEDITGAGYQFFYEALPTSVRYEVTLDDGGTFPVSTQELFNEVTVRWTDKDGRPRTNVRTLACAALDDAGITRSTVIDLGDEIGSTAAANRAGDNFLAEHNVPKNAGTLNVSRPIRDLTLGRMVAPFEIEPRELIRVRGVESNPDALNADSNDGQTVFRIWATTYTSDSNTAALELDTDARTTTNALRKLAKRRNRKR